MEKKIKMHQFFEFLLNHWVLSSLFILVLILIIIEEARAKGLGGTGITPQKLIQLINQDQVSIIDIRPVNQFKDGHIINSKNLPMEAIDNEIKKLEKKKEKQIVVVDMNGQKSNTVANKLRKAGFEKVFLLIGGINAWKSANMPVVKKG